MAVLPGLAPRGRCRVFGEVSDVGPEKVLGRVEDDGRGFDTANGHTGVGLRSMRERTALLDGALEVSRHPGGGTLVEVAVPLGEDR